MPNNLTYHTPCAFDAMSIASKVGGEVFVYSMGDCPPHFAVTLGQGAIAFDKVTLKVKESER